MTALTMARLLPLVAALLMTSLAAPAFAADHRDDRDRHRPHPHGYYAPGYSYYAPPTVVYAPPPPPIVAAPFLSLSIPLRIR